MDMGTSSAIWTAMALAAILAPTCLIAQVTIPAPDDLVERRPSLPPTANPAEPAPLPPPPSAPGTMTAEEARAAARSLGGAMRAANQGLATAPGAAGQIPGYDASYPDAAQYYDNPAALAPAGAAAGQASEAYRTINAGTRPTVDVRRSDLARANAVAADPNAYLEGTTTGSTGGNCVPLPKSEGTPNTAEWTCNVGERVEEQPKTCTRSLTVTAWAARIWQYLCISSPGYPGCTALAGSSLCRSTGTFAVPEFGITADYYDCDAAMTEPGAFLLGTIDKPPPPDAFQVSSEVYRCNNEGLTGGVTFDPATGLPNGYASGLAPCSAIPKDGTCTRTTAAATGLTERQLCKTLDFTQGAPSCAAIAAPEEVWSCNAAVPGVTAERSVSRWFTQSWTQSACTADQSVCTGGTETCTAADEVRLIDGVPVRRPCWETVKSWQCQTIAGGGNDCGKLEQTPGCKFASETCLDETPSSDGTCKVAERVYKCPIPGTQDQPAQYICGGDVYCIGGDCEPVEREASDEFKDAVVALNALGQANAEFDESTLSLFKGAAEGCSHKLFGLANCCSGKGVPLLTPLLCSPSEVLLDKHDDAGLCHKIGTYCSSSFLGTCLSKRDSYCCFQSKLSRILQEQGRIQLGKGWGTPKKPVCDGFSVFEFQQLDLSKMDFSEVYAEFVDAAKLPDEAAALIAIQQKIEAYYAAHQH